MEEFKKYLKLEKKSQQTINNYVLAVDIYKQWLKDSTNVEFTKLIRENIIDFIFYMRKIKKTKKRSSFKSGKYKSVYSRISQI